jgi:hypothetical protein
MLQLFRNYLDRSANLKKFMSKFEKSQKSILAKSFVNIQNKKRKSNFDMTNIHSNNDSGTEANPGKTKFQLSDLSLDDLPRVKSTNNHSKDYLDETDLRILSESNDSWLGPNENIHYYSSAESEEGDDGNSSGNNSRREIMNQMTDEDNEEDEYSPFGVDDGKYYPSSSSSAAQNNDFIFGSGGNSYRETPPPHPPLLQKQMSFSSQYGIFAPTGMSKIFNLGVKEGVFNLRIHIPEEEMDGGGTADNSKKDNSNKNVDDDNNQSKNSSRNSTGRHYNVVATPVNSTDNSPSASPSNGKNNSSTNFPTRHHRSSKRTSSNSPASKNDPVNSRQTTPTALDGQQQPFFQFQSTAVPASSTNNNRSSSSRPLSASFRSSSSNTTSNSTKRKLARVDSFSSTNTPIVTSSNRKSFFPADENNSEDGGFSPPKMSNPESFSFSSTSPTGSDMIHRFTPSAVPSDSSPAASPWKPINTKGHFPTKFNSSPTFSDGGDKQQQSSYYRAVTAARKGKVLKQLKLNDTTAVPSRRSPVPASNDNENNSVTEKDSISVPAINIFAENFTFSNGSNDGMLRRKSFTGLVNSPKRPTPGLKSPLNSPPQCSKIRTATSPEAPIISIGGIAIRAPLEVSLPNEKNNHPPKNGNSGEDKEKEKLLSSVNLVNQHHRNSPKSASSPSSSSPRNLNPRISTNSSNLLATTFASPRNHTHNNYNHISNVHQSPHHEDNTADLTLAPPVLPPHIPSREEGGEGDSHNSQRNKNYQQSGILAPMSDLSSPKSHSAAVLSAATPPLVAPAASYDSFAAQGYSLPTPSSSTYTRCNSLSTSRGNARKSNFSTLTPIDPNIVLGLTPTATPTHANNGSSATTSENTDSNNILLQKPPVFPQTCDLVTLGEKLSQTSLEEKGPFQPQALKLKAPDFHALTPIVEDEKDESLDDFALKPLALSSPTHKLKSRSPRYGQRLSKEWICSKCSYQHQGEEALNDLTCRKCGETRANS